MELQEPIPIDLRDPTPRGYDEFLDTSGLSDDIAVRLLYELVRLWIITDGDESALEDVMKHHARALGFKVPTIDQPGWDFIDTMVEWKDEVDKDKLDSFQSTK